MFEFLNALLFMSSAMAAEPVDAKKVILKEERYEINRSVDESTNSLEDAEKKSTKVKEIAPTKTAQKSTETETAKPKLSGCTTKAEILLVDVSINLLQLSEPIRVEKLANGSLVLPELIFKELKLVPKSEKIQMSDCSYGYPLNTSSGLTYNFDSEKFALDIRVPVELFELNVFKQKESYKLNPDKSPSGGFANYQVYATQTKASDSISGVFDLTGFNKKGSLSTGLIVNQESHTTNLIRTSTYYQKDLPDKMQSFVVGDTVNNDGNWSRSANYFGVKWSRNFSTQPGYI